LFKNRKSTEAVQVEMKDFKVVFQQFVKDLRTIASLPSQKPKELGFEWERGQPEDHIQVDDGLGPTFYLPLDLCCSLEVT
jgi:hypothetical protein